MNLTTRLSAYFLIAVVCGTLSSSCATVAHGTRQMIEIRTDPPGASATVGSQTVTTPGSLRIERELKEAEIRIEKSGFRSEVIELNRRRTGALWWNLALIPLGVAAGTAAGCDRDAFLCGDVDAAASLGLLLVPLVGFVTDLATGGAYRLDPPTISIVLVPLDGHSDDSIPVQQHPGLVYRSQ